MDRAPEPDRPAPPTPLWRNRPAWLSPPALTVAWALALVYGSMMPFDQQWSALGWSTLVSPTWVNAGDWDTVLGVPAWAADLGLNLLIYIPLGVLGRVSLERWRLRPLPGPVRFVVRTAITIAGVTALSWAMECTQSLTPMRYASLEDVFANAGTGALAALLTMPVLWAGRWLAFRAYCRGIGLWHTMTGLRWLWVSLAVIGLTGTVLALPGLTGSSGVPMRRLFDQPYDTVALTLALAGAGYGVVALAVGYLGRGSPIRVVLYTAGCTAGAQAIGYGLGLTDLDTARPLIAAAAAVGVLTLIEFVAGAIRRHNRRRASCPVSVERRQRAHAYTG